MYDLPNPVDGSFVSDERERGFLDRTRLWGNRREIRF
jgi:hypothetical protein